MEQKPNKENMSETADLSFLRKRKVYQKLANAAEVFNSKHYNKTIWQNHWETPVEEIMENLAPSGSGFDNGTTFEIDQSSRKKLIFTTAYHHMNEAGYYTEWTYHTVTVVPDLLLDFEISVSGKNHNEIKPYIEEQFHYFLTMDIDY